MLSSLEDCREYVIALNVSRHALGSQLRYATQLNYISWIGYDVKRRGDEAYYHAEIFGRADYFMRGIMTQYCLSYGYN